MKIEQQDVARASGRETRETNETSETKGLARRPAVPIAIGALTLLAVSATLFLHRHAKVDVSGSALAAEPKGVSVVKALPTQYRATRRYIGSVQPWLEARIGPQMLSAYVDTVLVRPGDVVRRGDVLATLDCRSAATANQASAAQARALQERQKAMAAESVRLGQLAEGGYVAPNELEQKQASTKASEAQLEALRAELAGKSLQVSDCTLRAPFDGEIGVRAMDPGGFARPGATVVNVVDRHLLRVSADAPETDVAGLAPKTPVSIKLLASGKEIKALIARRAPAADPATRTVHFEIDVDPKEARVPVGTTADILVDFGEPVDALEIPLVAAKVRGDKAHVFVVEGGVAHARALTVLGERGASLFVERDVPPESEIVKEGRSRLSDQDKVIAKLEGEGRGSAPPASNVAPASVKGAANP